MSSLWYQAVNTSCCYPISDKVSHPWLWSRLGHLWSWLRWRLKRVSLSPSLLDYEPLVIQRLKDTLSWFELPSWVSLLFCIHEMIAYFHVQSLHIAALLTVITTPLSPPFPGNWAIQKKALPRSLCWNELFRSNSSCNPEAISKLRIHFISSDTRESVFCQ